MTVSKNNPFLLTRKGNVRTSYVMQDGNSKVGKMLTSCNLSGDKPREVKGVTITGSCPCTCMSVKKDGTPKVGCYAIRDEVQYTETREYNACQLWGWRNEPEQVMADYDAQLSDTLSRDTKAGRTTVVRIHASGDFAHALEAKFWLRMAIKYPNIHFYAYTKQYGMLHEAVCDMLADQELDGRKLENFVLNISVWGEMGKEHVHDFDDILACNIFEVQTPTTPAKGIIRCPAYKPDGSRRNEEKYHCDHCGFCWESGDKHIVTYEH